MSCEICGRSSCTRSFHGFDEQNAFDEKADDIKDRTRAMIYDSVNRKTDGQYMMVDGEESYYVKLDDVLSVIDDVSL